MHIHLKFELVIVVIELATVVIELVIFVTELIIAHLPRV